MIDNSINVLLIYKFEKLDTKHLLGPEFELIC
jgi:hypothetical protein